MKVKNMTKPQKLLSFALTVIFVLAEGALFYLIHFEKAASEINLRYLSIQLAALFSLATLLVEILFSEKSKYRVFSNVFNLKNGNALRIAMLFTLAADYYLVANSAQDKLSGMLFFMGTQAFIFLHIFLRDENKKRRIANLSVRLGLSAILVIATLIVLGNGADALAIISIIYYANLLTSMIFAPGDKCGGKLLCLGLVLFALCDINVGLWVLNDMYFGGFPEGSFLYKLLFSGIDLAWVFYIPSQTIIALVTLIKKTSHTP